MKQQTENRLVVADIGWAESIPDYIKDAIKEERLIYGFADILNGTETVGDAEVLAYLYTSNLRGNIGYYLSEVFIYLTGKVMQKAQKIKTEDLPDFCRDKLKYGLNEDEQRELNELKQNIWRVRGGKINTSLLNIMREFSRKCKGRTIENETNK